MSRTFFAHFKRNAAAPEFALSLRSSLFDMRLSSFSFTAVSGPQLTKAIKPRSIIYAVIVHEVYFALAERRSDWGYAERVSRSPHFRDYFSFAQVRFSWRSAEAGCPISTSGTLGL